jgi:hypothetical protein
MYRTLTMDEFVETYKPIKNPNNDWGDECEYSAFETYGDDLNAVQLQNEKFVWTEVDGDDGIYIVSGMAFVNRIQYYICEVPFDEDKFQEVLVCLDQDCETCENPETVSDCDDCGGSGYISHYPDTREELVELIGDTRANATI